MRSLRERSTRDRGAEIGAGGGPALNGAAENTDWRIGIVTKAELVKAVADRSGLSQKQAGQVLDAVLETVTEALAKGEEVRIVGFGAFAPVKRAARAGRNPRTGEEISIPARVVPAFRAGRELKAAVGRA